MPSKPPRRTRERILAQALGLFNATGEPNVTTGAIADALDISPGNLYYHFHHKEDIVEALLRQFEAGIEPLLEAPPREDIHVEDAWLFLHLLFEAILRHRFIYRDLTDLVSRYPRLGVRLRTLIERKTRAARRLCEALQRAGQLSATAAEIGTLTTAMVLVMTWWLSYEEVSGASRFADAGDHGACLARGVHQVLAMLAPYLDPDGRALFQRLAGDYLEP